MSGHVAIQEEERRRRRRDSGERRVGQALADALREGNRFRDQQERFRSYLNAHAVAADLINALTRYPGFVEIEQQRVMAKMTEVTKAVTRARNYIAKQLQDNYEIEAKHPDQVAQITRLAAQAVIRQWGEDGTLFDKLPDGSKIHSDETKMVLTTMYIHYVSQSVAQEDLEDPEGGESIDDETLDRVLAGYSVFLRLDDATSEFLGMTSGLEEELRPLLFGWLVNETNWSSDELTHQVADLIVFPIAKERQEAILGAFDPEGRFAAREKRITYRAMLNHVSRDVSAVLSHEGESLINRVLAMTPREREEYQSSNGLLVDWLKNRVNKRLDRLYPQPAEYVESQAPSTPKVSSRLANSRRELPNRDSAS